MNNKSLTIVSTVFGLVALLGLGLCVAHFVTKGDWKDAVQTKGQVVDHDERRKVSTGSNSSTRSKHKNNVYPIISFTDENGATHQFTASSGSSSPPSIGTSVDVEYKKGDPASAREASTMSRNILLFVGLGLALIFGFFAVLARMAGGRMAGRPA